MSFFIFPSSKRPRIYISNKKNTFIFFVNNLLSSKKALIQFLINIFRLLVPKTLAYFLLRSIMIKEIKLPHEILGALIDIQEVIDKNNIFFLSTSSETKDIDFIIRKSSWQRLNNKYVVILFTDDQYKPFGVAKIESLQNRDSMELEFNNTSVVYNKFREIKLALIPEPLGIYVFQNAVVYFERTIDGTPLNCFLKSFVSKKKKLNVYLSVLDTIKKLLLTIDHKKELLTSQEFSSFFYEPIELLRKTEFGHKYSLRLESLQEHADKLQNKIHSVLMHGDMWGGSILFNQDKLGIIDWEFFTMRGVPLWDYFSISFHPGVAMGSNHVSMDFMNYFSNSRIASMVDEHLLSLSKSYQIEKNDIPFLFQSYLLFNMRNRDTCSEKYWQSCLEIYWNIVKDRNNSEVSLL